MLDQNMRTGSGQEKQDKRPGIETFHLKTFDQTLSMCHVVITVVNVDNTTVNQLIKVMIWRRSDKKLEILNIQL